MSNFTVSITVENEDEASRNELNKIMESYGFKRTIHSDSGKSYKLPPGEFSFSGPIDRKSLLEIAKASVGQIGKRYSILITESKGRTWHNLQIQ